MTLFADYISVAHDGINADDDALEEEWAARDTWLADREAKLRAALIAALLLWPFDERGRLDTRRRAEIRKQIREADRLIAKFEDDVNKRFVGAANGRRRIRVTKETVYGFSSRTAQTHVWDSADRGRETAILLDGIARDAMRLPPPDSSRRLQPGPDRPLLTPPKIVTEADIRAGRVPRTTDSLRGVKDKEGRVRWFEGGVEVDPYTDPRFSGWRSQLRKLDKRLKEAEATGDQEEVARLSRIVEATIDNPWGNTLTGGRQMRESVNDLSYSRGVTRGQVVEHINGNPNPRGTSAASSQPGGIALNRNAMKLSTVTHGRTAFRSGLEDWAQARQINHYILEYPVAKRESISPGGILSRQVHQVRTGSEWADLYRKESKKKTGTGTATFGGFHHGDFSYLIPIPFIFLAEAEEYSKRSRKRLIDYKARRLSA